MDVLKFIQTLINLDGWADIPVIVPMGIYPYTRIPIYPQGCLPNRPDAPLSRYPDCPVPTWISRCLYIPQSVNRSVCINRRTNIRLKSCPERYPDTGISRCPDINPLWQLTMCPDLRPCRHSTGYMYSCMGRPVHSHTDGCTNDRGSCPGVVAKVAEYSFTRNTQDQDERYHRYCLLQPERRGRQIDVHRSACESSVLQ